MKKKDWVSISVYLGTFCGMFLITARSIILPTALSELQAEHFYDLAVLITSLAMCTILPISGKLSDFCGRKKIFLTGIIIFILSNFLCMISSNVYIYLFGLLGTGIAYGLVNSVQLAILNDICDEEERPGKVSNVNISNSLACLLGPIVGGGLTDFFSWRIVYVVAIPFLIVAMVIMFLYKEEKHAPGRIEVDIAGTFFYIVALIPTILLLSGKRLGVYQLQSIVIGLIVCASVGIVGFFLVEKRAKIPIIAYQLFRSSNFRFCMISYLICSIGFAAINYLPLYYQQVRLLSVTVSGLIVIPRQLSQLLMGFVLRKDMKKISGKTWPVVIGFVCFAISMLFIADFDLQTDIVKIILAEIFFGFGYSALTIITQSNSQLDLPTEDVGSGTSLIGLFGALGNTLGAAIGSVVLGAVTSLAIGLKYFFLANAGLMICGIILGIVRGKGDETI